MLLELLRLMMERPSKIGQPQTLNLESDNKPVGDIILHKNGLVLATLMDKPSLIQWFHKFDTIDMLSIDT